MSEKIEYFQNDQDLRNFFSSSLNEKYFYLTYEEYLRIFGISINEQNLSRINKKIVYGHLDYFNECYDSLWIYKWFPLLLKFLLNSGFLNIFQIFYEKR